MFGRRILNAQLDWERYLSLLLLFALPIFSFEANSLAGLDDIGVTPVGTFTVNLKSHSQVDFYYPISTESNSYRTVVLFQGGRIDKSNYSKFSTLLASQGFVVVVPNTHWMVGLLDLGYYPELATLNEAFQATLAESKRADSPLYAKVDPTRLGVVGHSFGGVAVLKALEGSCSLPFCRKPYVRPPELKAAVVFNTKSSLGPFTVAVNTRQIPVAFIGGDYDGKSAFDDVVSTYHQASTPKALVKIGGANHFCMTNGNGAFGAIPDPSAPKIAQELCNQTSAYWTGVYLDAYLNSNAASYDLLFKSQANLVEGVTVQVDAN